MKREKMQNILIVDDERSNIDILLGIFKKINQNNSFNITAVKSAKQALTMISKREMDLILLDIMMPEMDGYELCKILKDDEKTKHIPILFITSNTDDKSIITAYNAGAEDYITKPFRPIEIIARVKLNLKLQENLKTLQYINDYDVKTDVYNREKFFEVSEKLFISQKNKSYLVITNIDKLRTLNELYGHTKGDEAIVQIVTTIKNNLNEKAILGRLSGEEFAIYLEESSKEEAIEVMENIRKIVEKVELAYSSNNTILGSITNGIVHNNGSILNIESFVQKAYQALNEAKMQGRNLTIFKD